MNSFSIQSEVPLGLHQEFLQSTPRIAMNSLWENFSKHSLGMFPNIPLAISLRNLSGIALLILPDFFPNNLVEILSKISSRIPSDISSKIPPGISPKISSRLHLESPRLSLRIYLGIHQDFLQELLQNSCI